MQVTSGSNWLATSANANNTTPSTLTVSVNSAPLAAGTYNGNIQIQPTGGTVVNVPVTLTVTAPAAISATPTSLTFNYRAGDSAPASQPRRRRLQPHFYRHGRQYRQLAGGFARHRYRPATVNVSVNPTGLSTGTYNGTVIVAGTNGATGSTTVTVT